MPSTQTTAMNPATMLNVLKRLLDRLYVSLFNGPAMNARCHASRQRVDFLAPLKALQVPDADQTLTRLFTDGTVTIPATIAPFVAPVDAAQKLTFVEAARAMACAEVLIELADRLNLGGVRARTRRR